MTLLLRGVIGFLMLKLVVLGVNLIQFPVLGKRVRPATGSMLCEPEVVDRISLLVPMRNEARRLSTSLPGLLAQHVDELILLDDESTDDCATLARALLADHPGARVVAGSPAPPGWVGKNWACHQLASQATGAVLVFCDADVSLAPGAVTAVVAEMRAQRAEVFSVFPRQLAATLGEQLITPLIDDVLLCFLPFGLLSMDVPSAATANGSLLAFSRVAYNYLGGFATVRDSIVEDVAIARHARAEGLKLGLALGGEAVQTRMYTGYGEVVRGLSRGLLPVAGGSRARLAAGFSWHLLAYTLPWLLVRQRRSWLVPLLLGVTERALVDLKTGRGIDLRTGLVPLSPLAALPVVARAMRRRQSWKGRCYS